MKKLTNHIRRWNKWRKRSKDSSLHKILVLFGVSQSPTLCWTFTDEEEEMIRKAFQGGKS